MLTVAIYVTPAPTYVKRINVAKNEPAECVFQKAREEVAKAYRVQQTEVQVVSVKLQEREYPVDNVRNYTGQQVSYVLGVPWSTCYKYFELPK